MSSTPTHELFFVLLKVSKALTQWAKSNIPTDGGMTVPRATVLIGLSTRTEPAGMSELGDYLGMSPRNMTVLIDGLEREGLVRRTPHPRDRRITCVEITDNGMKVARDKLGPSELVSASLFDDLSAREQADLLRLLGKVSESLRARGIDVPLYRSR
ncbi:Putative transcriptional regulator, MarR [Mycobacteroides abscessus subsp. bolletii]|uniref:Transcriptional regulator, MarR n=1 Tax=Mycobacteroides abscessus subsp. bolletii TaxID=319705 RepID=A0A9Q7SJH4_9MYCO|nr:MarR family transcriptional regulator [Mycobacteroides abscessus]AMU19966.1 MarR family transcriptional regulator [Mycobacteroides abscessus]MBN7300551.1 MarR family transcriptional regulator [Mycobacteroides abscessus subsp. bolletii]MDO2969107.1 MarR family transcriptional regulator [Mycobacteroides abscessus subsp. bolletii]MDO3067981.1 MarR family transcriptional regulator [Mycobacteroides abscessus subsp. bolletii]MDO3079112.1 MarR family transcriptional regulator [Mycobacteroides absc